MSTQYYSIFFLRRLSYLFAQVYLNDNPYIQAGINIGFSVLQLFHLLYYLPFKEIHILISVITGELASTIFISMSTVYLGNISPSVSKRVETIMIYSVMTGITVHFFASICTLILSFRLMWRKVLKYRAKAFIKAGNTLDKSVQGGS